MELPQNAHEAPHTELAAPDAAPQVVDTTSPSLQAMSPQQLVDHLAVLLQQDELPDRKVVDLIKNQFQRRKAALSAELTPAERETLEIHESRLEDLFTTFKERDRKRQELLEQLYKENKEKREALLGRFEQLFKGNEEGQDFAKLYGDFVQLRDEWKAIGEVAQQDQGPLSKRFYELRDQFYDLKAINDDLRQLDFKKNLEAKRALLEELRALESVKDPILAHRQLTELIAQWHDLGPVAKEQRAEIQAEYKALTSAQHKRHQEFHDQKKASYGGYSIYYLAGIHQKRFKTFIAHCGVFNLQSMYGTTEELFFNNNEIGGAYWDKKNAIAQKSYKEFNPIEKITEWDTPILIIHGGKDYRVPEEQGFQAFTAAQLRGIKSELLYFPDENHWVLQPQNGLLWQRTFFKWLKETL